jgi:hypothetical protein
VRARALRGAQRRRQAVGKRRGGGHGAPEGRGREKGTPAAEVVPSRDIATFPGGLRLRPRGAHAG